MQHPNAKIFSLPLTPAQRIALETAAPNGNLSEYIRLLIAKDCESKGIEWPVDLVERGRYQRNRQRVPAE